MAAPDASVCRRRNRPSLACRCPSSAAVTSLRQPKKVEYNFWLFNDPRDEYIGQYKRELDVILDASSITFRVKSLPYEHDYTREEDAFYGQTLGYS